MILIYNEARAVFFGKYTIVPGSNAVGDDFDLTHPTIAAMLKDGRIEKVGTTAAAQKGAISHAFTKKTVDAIAAASKDAGVKAAAKKRVAELEEIDREWADGLKSAKAGMTEAED